MNFLDRQRLKRQQSSLLLLCFFASLLFMAVVIHLVVVGVSHVLGEASSITQASTPVMVMIALVWMSIMAGGIFRAFDVRAGGAVLARRFGAVLASDRSRFDKEKQLLNIVAEMSIASSTQQPEVFVLRHEVSTNAFVLGGQNKSCANRRYAIVVTQGALDAFDRDQMKAVVAHEFGHISNGDLPLNMRLLVVLGGLNAIDEVGRFLVRSYREARMYPGVIVGYVLCGLGSLGVFFGKLIQAAFLRRRDFLADAAAVQFTRNPLALAEALSTIKKQGYALPLHGIHRQELAPLCFQQGGKESWYHRFLALYPTLSRRINAIAPHFSVKQRKAVSHEANSPTGDVLTPALETSHDSIVLAERGGFREPSGRIRILLSNESRCLAVLFALFANTDAKRQRDYLNAIAFGFNAEFSQMVKHMLASLPDEICHDQIGIIEHSTAVLRKSVLPESRQRILLKLERLLKVGGDLCLKNYASLQLIRRKLDVEFPLLETLATEHVAQGRYAKSFDEMGSEFALLLSLMVESSGVSKAVQNAEFERVLKCYTQTRYPRRTGNETGIVAELELAFQTLYMQPKPIRQAFVKHCTEIASKDGFVAEAERDLLELFAASLGCDALAA